MSKTVSVSFSPVINPEVCTEVVDAFAKSELGIAKAVKQATVARGKAINKMLDCMWVACDKPKDVFLKGNAATNGARFQIKAVFDAIVEAGNLTKATAASYQTGFWIAFEDGTPWTPDTANKKSEAKKAASTSEATSEATTASTSEATSEATTASTSEATSTNPRAASKVQVTTMGDLHRAISVVMGLSRVLNQQIYLTGLVELTLGNYPEFKETVLTK
jgi:hypothetical protein